MVKIPLTRGLFALVDDEDACLAQAKWYATPVRGGKFYAARKAPRGENGGKQRPIFLHRAVLRAPPGVDVDHRSDDKLDCRRANLRLATKSQNGANRGPASNNKSGFKGVRPFKGSWRAHIGVRGERRHLGTFSTPEEAARAYDRAALEAFGDFARLNFNGG